MEYMGNQEYWDDKFIKRSDKLLEPENSLLENIKYLKEGSVLDVACGDGRNAIFLIKNNFRVTGIDFSSKALERLEMFAKMYNYNVCTKQIDLCLPNAFDNIGMFDNILINHYKLSKENINEIEKHLNYNGILFICGFGYKHKIDSKIRKEDLLNPTDFEGLFKSFELIKYIENEDDRGFIVTYIFRKK